MYDPGAVGLGGQFGNHGSMLTTTGFAPSVRIFNDWVPSETYCGVIRPVFVFGLIPIANVTFPFAAFVESAPFMDCAVNTELCDCGDCGGIADVPMLAPPLVQPATMTAQSPMANTPLMMRLVERPTRTPSLMI